MELKEMKCVPCRGDVPALKKDEINSLIQKVPDWTVIDEDSIPKLQRAYKFKNFAQAMDFTNKVGDLAEEQDHHPMIQTEWGKVTVTWWTHKIKGLHNNDFVMAAKCDQAYH